MDLKERIIEISRKRGSTHIGSCLSAVGIIDEIYQTKKTEDVFVLSSGHAFLAWACVLEKYEGKNAEELAEKHGTHPNRAPEDGILVSAGSLGHGLGIALGMALANRERDVYCLISDGESNEGSVYEALRMKTEMKADNLKVYINSNGYTALGEINTGILVERLRSFCEGITVYWANNGEGYEGVQGHYCKAK